MRVTEGQVNQLHGDSLNTLCCIEERKIRLAKQYIEAVKTDLGPDADDKDLRSRLVADAVCAIQKYIQI